MSKPYNKQSHGKKYYPVSQKKHYPQKHRPNSSLPSNFMEGFFNENFTGKGMNFSNPNHEMSAYVEKTVVIRDRYGNERRAKQKFFLNSGKHIGRVRIHDDESEF